MMLLRWAHQFLRTGLREVFGFNSVWHPPPTHLPPTHPHFIFYIISLVSYLYFNSVWHPPPTHPPTCTLTHVLNYFSLLFYISCILYFTFYDYTVCSTHLLPTHPPIHLLEHTLTHSLIQPTTWPFVKSSKPFLFLSLTTQ